VGSFSAVGRLGTHTLTSSPSLARPDEAFKIFIESVNGSLSPALESLIPEILSYHVSNGTIDLANLTDVSGIETLLGNGSLSNIDPQILLATKTPSPPLLLTYGLGNAGVIDTISCSNGVIHVVNSVLYPPNPTSQTAILADLTSLAEALNATDLSGWWSRRLEFESRADFCYHSPCFAVDTIDSLEALTVFAPNNEAFEAIANVTANLTTEQLSSILT
jgi:transforming growth factor-beta-induced protein